AADAHIVSPAIVSCGISVQLSLANLADIPKGIGQALGSVSAKGPCLNEKSRVLHQLILKLGVLLYRNHFIKRLGKMKAIALFFLHPGFFLIKLLNGNSQEVTKSECVLQFRLTRHYHQVKYRLIVYQ